MGNMCNMGNKNKKNTTSQLANANAVKLSIKAMEAKKSSVVNLWPLFN